MSYEVGSIYRAAFTVMDDTGALADPAAKTVTVTLPDQTTATPTINRDSLGTFHADYTLAQEGLHKISVQTTGPLTNKTDYVNAGVWRSIIGVDEARSFVGIDADEDITSLRQILAAATEMAEGIAGSCVQRRFVNERVTGVSRQVIRLPHAPLPSETAVETITSVYPGGPTWDNSMLIVYPDSGTVEVSSLWIPFWYGPWKVTYTAGRLVIPERIQLAVKEVVFDLWSLLRPYATDRLEPGPEDTARYEQMIAGYTMAPHAKAMLELEAIPGFGG